MSTGKDEVGQAEQPSIEEVLYDALEVVAEGEPGALDALLADHPNQAAEVIVRLARLRELGLVEDGSGSRALPERLGGFRLIEQLGEGGMGLVWAAEEEALGRRVALKMVRPEQLWFRGARERFRREVEAVARLQHPGIVPVYAVGEESGVPFFTMELLDGCTLADALSLLRGRDPRTLSGQDLRTAVEAASRAREDHRASSHGVGTPASWSDTCLQIARQMAEALDYAHGRGLVHRDVKPSNVAIVRSGRAMLFDFGLARSGEVDRMTRTGSQLGSLPYMSPEQVRGEEDLDARTDVYSLGATLYELLTLKPAFELESVPELQAAILAGRFPRPRQIVRSIASDVETVCLKAMAREPDQRYASADDFAHDLGNLLARRPIEARRAGALLRVVRWSQRHPRASAALIAALPLTALALGGVAWIQTQRRAEEESLRRVADNNAAVATEQKQQVLRLSDVRRLSDLLRDEERLWPAHPEKIAEHESWLARARELMGRIEIHRATLADLERSAAVRTEDGSRRFASTEEEWQHDTLADLIRGLESIAAPEEGLIARVESRLGFARTIDERSRSGDAARSRWSECLKSVADRSKSPHYGGLALAPQIGLLPIGQDPASHLWEFAHLQTGDPAERDEKGKLHLTQETGLVFVLLPGGAFRMGSADDPDDPDYDPLGEDPREHPRHLVELDPFFISKYDVTVAQWERIQLAKAPPDSNTGPMHPAANLSWEEAQRASSRLALVLPTEAQWEYACRAGTDTPWWTGSDKESLQGAANLLDATVARKRPTGGRPVEEWLDDGWSYTSPVDAMRPNPFGLHDMMGNVYQACRDRFAPYTNTVRPGDGERTPSNTLNRIARGGSAASMIMEARCAYRIANDSSYKSWAFGFRPARTLDR
jgi:serine/threonine protein kinase/formylglycine-generating enzyme required for sulfatase activity